MASPIFYHTNLFPLDRWIYDLFIKSLDITSTSHQAIYLYVLSIVDGLYWFGISIVHYYYQMRIHIYQINYTFTILVSIKIISSLKWMNNNIFELRYLLTFKLNVIKYFLWKSYTRIKLLLVKLARIISIQCTNKLLRKYYFLAILLCASMVDDNGALDISVYAKV